MDKKKIRWIAFILVVLAQLFVPAQMIWESERVIDEGTAFKFKTAPVDPNDPFRGKYITLNYSDNSIEVEEDADWKNGEPVYAIFYEDAEGFAQIKAVSREKPKDEINYLKTRVRYISIQEGQPDKLLIDYPFNRFYMEESKAYDEEQEYRMSETDTSSTTYALVYVKKGRAVLKDVLIDGVSIQEIVKRTQADREPQK